MVAVGTMCTKFGRGTTSVPILTEAKVEVLGELDMLTSQDKKSCKDMGSACHKMAARNRSSKSRQMRNSFKHRRSTQNDEFNVLLDDNSHTKCILSRISDWSFDVFALDKASNGRALFHVILTLFKHHNLIDTFQLDPIKLMKFATLVESGYHQNPYHNAVHAADVTQAMHCYISQTKIAKHMTPVEKLISLVSAITHDLDHPGVNQAYLIATGNPLAARHDNTAVLEKHHWRAALSALHHTKLFDHLPTAVRAKIEEEMRSLILATDMSRQQEFFTTLRRRVNENSLDMAAYADRHFILQIALKCADISNPCRPWSSCKTWSERVCDEFFRQGDYERELDIPISNLCDRYQNTVPKIQIGFINYVVEPLFAEFERYLFPCSTLSEQVTFLGQNKAKWQERIDAAAKPAAAKPAAARPTSIDLSSLANVDLANDIPSPTPSVESDDGATTTSCSCSSDEYTYLHDIFDRRHSVPVLNLLRKRRSLVRRRSFPNGFKPQFQEETIRIDPVLLLESLAGKLSKMDGDANNNGSGDATRFDARKTRTFCETLRSLFNSPEHPDVLPS